MKRIFQLLNWFRPKFAKAESITIAGIYQLTLRRKKQLELPALPPVAVEPEPQTVTVPSARVIELSPVEVEMIQVAEQFAPDKKPRNRRSALVEGLLDEGWSMGITTYPKLIAYVERHTGEACSRRAIANWKRKRGMLEVEQAA